MLSWIESHCKPLVEGKDAHSNEAYEFVTRLLFVLAPVLLACFLFFSHFELKCSEKESILASQGSSQNLLLSKNSLLLGVLGSCSKTRNGCPSFTSPRLFLFCTEGQRFLLCAKPGDIKMQTSYMPLRTSQYKNQDH